MTARGRRWLVVFTVVAGIGLFTATRGQANDDGFKAWKNLDERVLIGFKIAPVPLQLKGLNPSLVGIGSYIVNAQGGCNDCHTLPPYAEGGDPFLGQPEQVNGATYLAGGVPFGPFVSRNITPRANGLPANLTFQQFYETMTKGTDLKNRHPEISPLLQVMPWPVYGKMTPFDLGAVYEYLKAIPSLPTTPPPPSTVR